MTNHLNERIVVLRKGLNLSQEALAEQLGVSRQAISKWERGETSPDIQNLSALADVFGMTVDELIHDEAANSPTKTKLVGMDLRKSAEKLIIIAVAIFIISAFSFTSLPFNGKTNLLIFGLLITLGVLMCIKAGFMFERFYMLNKNQMEYNVEAEGPTRQYKRRRDAVGTVVALLCVIVYLFISFVYGLWHPGWLIFLLIPIVYAVFDLISFKEPRE